jgi:hypothetical protein
MARWYVLGGCNLAGGILQLSSPTTYSATDPATAPAADHAAAPDAAPATAAPDTAPATYPRKIGRWYVLGNCNRTGEALGQASLSAPVTDPATVLATDLATAPDTAFAQTIRGASCTPQLFSHNPNSWRIVMNTTEVDTLDFITMTIRGVSITWKRGGK